MSRSKEEMEEEKERGKELKEEKSTTEENTLL